MGADLELILILCLEQQSPYLMHELYVCTPGDILDVYYDMLEATLTDNGIVGKPMQVFNMDETGMPLDPNLASVIAPVGSRHVSCMRSGDKTNTTVVAYYNASGSIIPPLVVLDRKFLSLSILMVKYLELHMHFQGVVG